MSVAGSNIISQYSRYNPVSYARALIDSNCNNKTEKATDNSSSLLVEE
jgi:hypothetical protein